MPPITLRGYDIISKNGIRVRLALVKGTYRGYVSEAFINNKSLYFHDEFGFYIDTKTNNNFKAEQIIKNNMYW